MNVQEKFWNAVSRGTGEAHVLMKKYPKTDFSKLILKAALKNLDYDPQSNGSRATYVVELINLSIQKDSIVQGVLKALARKTNNTWALEQLFDIAAIFAKEGNEQAKQAIYNRYPVKKINDSDWCGESAILDLDEMEGLKFIAETKGKAMINNSDIWEDDFQLRNFQEKNTSVKVYSELKKASKSNIYIKKYLDAIKETKERWGKRKPEKKQSTYDRVNEIIETNRVSRIPPPLTRELKEKDLKLLAERFLKETNDVKQIKYLSVFEQIKFPFDYRPLLEIAKTKNNKKNRLVEFANTALSFFNAKDIRDFAVSKLKRTKEPYLYTDILVNNYKKGDCKLLEQLVKNAKTAEQAHTLVWSYVKIYEKNKMTECCKPLESLYNKLNCGRHRSAVVKILADNKVLSKKIREEIKFDSYWETRGLFL